MGCGVARVLVAAAASALLVAACGKTSTTSRVSGVYHLPGSADATSLEVRDDGTFALRRESCVSSGVVSCGDWIAPMNPDAMCNTCLQASLGQGGACQQAASDACNASTDCKAEQKCITPCQTKN